MNEDRCVAPLDAVEGIEDRRVHDRPEPLTGGVRRVRRDQRVNEDLVPIEHLIAGGRLIGSRAVVEPAEAEEMRASPHEQAAAVVRKVSGFHRISLSFDELNVSRSRA